MASSRCDGPAVDQRLRGRRRGNETRQRRPVHAGSRCPPRPAARRRDAATAKRSHSSGQNGQVQGARHREDCRPMPALPAGAGKRGLDRVGPFARTIFRHRSVAAGLVPVGRRRSCSALATSQASAPAAAALARSAGWRIPPAPIRVAAGPCGARRPSVSRSGPASAPTRSRVITITRSGHSAGASQQPAASRRRPSRRSSDSTPLAAVRR